MTDIAWKRLIDIPDGALKVRKTLERFFRAHSITWREKRNVRRGFACYSVAAVDFCCASAALLAIRQIAADLHVDLGEK